MKCGRQTSPLAATLALASVIHSAVGSVQVDFEDAYTHGVVSVGVGSPPTQYSLIFDTASSNTWIGANAPYIPTSTSQETGDTVSISYGHGAMSGKEYVDQLALSDQLVVSQQSIGVASSSNGFPDSDGILGLGPTDLTQGTVSGKSTVPTVLDNLFSEKTIQDKVVHIANKKITFGGFDETLFVGSISYAPLTTSSPANQYWGIDADFAYGGNTLLQGSPGVVDYMQTTISLAEDAFKMFLELTGASLDKELGLPVLDSCSGLQPMNLTIGGQAYEMPSDFYTWPQDQNSLIGGASSKCYLAVDQVSGDAQGIDFFLGYNTLKHFNIILDATNNQVGFVNAVVAAKA